MMAAMVWGDQFGAWFEPDDIIKGVDDNDKS